MDDGDGGEALGAETDPEVVRRLTSFRGDLVVRTPTDVVRRHIIAGSCYSFDDDVHFALRDAVGRGVGIHPEDVVVVGSAKLGFSIAPEKQYRPFGETSDVDVALVSADLFDEIWREALQFDESGGDWPAKAEFRKYLFRGWIRPDKFPPSVLFPRATSWTDLFMGLTSSGDYGPYKINGGIYRSRFHLELYQERSVRLCATAETGTN